MVDINPRYRNTRSNFYTDKFSDTLEIGSIVQALKSGKDSLDHKFVPTNIPVNGTSSYAVIPGSAQPQNNPDYQYTGYLYCDGAEYYIKDYPALYSIIGNEYGGTANNGVTITNQGIDYPSDATVSFTAAPAGGVTATGTPVVSEGKIISIAVTNPGSGYITAPSVLFNVGGAGLNASASVRIANGSIQAVTPNNIFDIWPDDNMGTFKVPDLKAKKIVGNGPVYGTGTPTIGNSVLGVGIKTISGNWYLDKQAQKGKFSLGRVSTTGYEKITDTVGAEVIGSQIVKVSMTESKLQGPPSHNHILLHSEASELSSTPREASGDNYLAGYKPSTGSITSFSPSGGLAYTHKHALLKKPALAGTATYDLFNYSGGDSGTGTLKTDTQYWASGGQNAGTYELITSFPPATSSIFTRNSAIGGRQIVTAGTPIYNYTDYNYTTPQSGTTLAIPSGFSQAAIIVTGGAGSGAVYTTPGNSGGSSSVIVGSRLTVTATGGGGGRAASDNTGGTGGTTGSYSVSGPLTSEFNGSPGDSIDAGTGGSGPFPRTIYPNSPPVNEGGGSAGMGSNAGSDGAYVYVSNSGTSQPATYTSNTTVGVGAPDNAVLTNVTLEVGGSAGDNCGNRNGHNCNSGNGGAGKVMKLSLKQSLLSANNAFEISPNFSPGGPGGDGSGANDGGAGGGVTIVTRNGTLIAGAGGGGGGGGFGEGECGRDGAPHSPYGDGAQAVNGELLFTGAGAAGGIYGCAGGGGGGGGGGCGTSQQSGAAGGSGGGGGGNGDHGGGDGGVRGLSSYRSDIFDLISADNTNTGAGYVTITYSYEGSYWSSGGGGGAAGGNVAGALVAEDLAGVSSLTINVGAGGGGVYNSGTSSLTGDNGSVTIRFGVITGYEGATTITSVGDIISSGSAGVNIYDSGTGAGDGGGFKLPTTQVPTIVFEGGIGNGAAATATVTNGVVSSISKTQSGSGYTSEPAIRFLHGAGAGTIATSSILEGSVDAVTLVSGTSKLYKKYVKFGGSELERFIVLNQFDCTNVKRFSVKAARGNGVNGGNRPENGGDELRLYYNTDGSESFSDFIGVLIPIPTDIEVDSLYDGSGTGTEATMWYTYSIDLPTDAQVSGVKFKISQTRGATDDNQSDTDHYGICEFLYEYNSKTELTFVKSDSALSKSADELVYEVAGPTNSTYVGGMSANDVTFTMTSSTPLLPVPSIDPNTAVPLLEPYHLVKHLIKAF